MKRMLRRSTLILIFTIAFILGIGFFAVELVINAKDWVDQPYNAHISGDGGLEQAGKILDRNGAPLAQTVDGKRMYNEDIDVRCAFLHTVGDNSLNISTAIQSKYRSNLTGYSLIWGLNMPQSMRTSRDITLTVDADAGKAAYEVMKSYGKRGACVVYNYQTGEVICSVSMPGYDPQAPPDITTENEKQYDGVYLDNVVSSTYTPGSIFKLITAAAAIENIPDLFERTWTCTGDGEIGGHPITCVEEHYEIGFEEAMRESCNYVFASLAVELGSEKMNAAATRMGINSSFSFDDISTPKGHYDTSNATENELAWSGAGQYSDKVNPMQMAIICGAIARGGQGLVPTYIKSGSGDILKDIGFKGNQTCDLVNQSTAKTLAEVMPKYEFGGLDIRAKTGTAEVGEDKLPNSWFVGYSTDADAPLAFACVIEDAGFGSTYARPVVEAAMEASARAVRKG